MQFQGNVFNRHPLYQLPISMPQNVVTNFSNKLGWLHSREFAVSPRIDWVKLGEVGLTEKMAPYLTNTFTMDGFSFICNGWKNLFEISELVFK